MSIKYGTTEITDIIYNGTTVKKVIYDGTTVYQKTKTVTEALPFTWYPPATTSGIGFPNPSFTLSQVPIKFVSVTCTDTVKSNTITISGDLGLKWNRPTATGNDPSTWKEVSATVSGKQVTFPVGSGGSSSYPQTGTMTFTYEYIE